MAKKSTKVLSINYQKKFIKSGFWSFKNRYLRRAKAYEFFTAFEFIVRTAVQTQVQITEHK